MPKGIGKVYETSFGENRAKNYFEKRSIIFYEVRKRQANNFIKGIR